MSRVQRNTARGNTRNQKPLLQIHQEANQYYLLTNEESDDDINGGHNITPTRIENLSKSSTCKRTNEQNQTQSDKSKQQHNVAKATERPVGIMGDSMLKMLSPSKLRRSIGKKITIKTFPGATASDMKHYISTYPGEESAARCASRGN